MLLLSVSSRHVVLAAIRLYQTCLSPHKGFRCAYRCHTGRASCSQLGFRAVRRHGVWGGWSLLRQRLTLCGVAHRRHALPQPRFRPQSQRGDCDVGCDAPCDCGDAADCLDCDLFKRRKKRQASPNEAAVHLPPRRSESP